MIWTIAVSSEARHKKRSCQFLSKTLILEYNFHCLSFPSFEYANLKSLGPVASHDSLREETAVKREQKLSPMLISPQMLHM